MKLTNKSKIIIFIVSCMSLIILALALNLSGLNKVLNSSKDNFANPAGIVLTQDEVYLEIGSSFNAKDYVKSAYDESGKSLINQIQINEMIDTSVPAEYEVDYLIKNRGVIIDKKTLKIYVIEPQ